MTDSTLAHSQKPGQTQAPTVWPTLRYDDARTAIRFLVDVLGFEEALVVDGDPSDVVAHAELRWPEGGAVMLGSNSAPDLDEPIPAGTGSVYVVTNVPDAVYARVRNTDARIILDIHEASYGSRTFTIRDNEGVYWTFGTYRGA